MLEVKRLQFFRSFKFEAAIFNLFFSLRFVLLISIVSIQSNARHIDQNKAEPKQFFYFFENGEIETIDSSLFSDPEKIVALYFGSSAANILLGAFAEMTNLEELHIDYNNLTKIEKGAFAGLSKLKKLILKANYNKEIDYEAFDLPALIEVELSINPLDEIDLSKIAAIGNLKKLDLEDTTTNIKCSTGTKITSNLEYLYLAENKVFGAKDLINKLSFFPKLEQLDISTEDYFGEDTIKLARNTFPNLKSFIVNYKEM